jgi:hypothetical protein
MVTSPFLILSDGVLSAMPLEIILSDDDCRFIAINYERWMPIPLRRTFSLMKMMNCQTTIERKITIDDSLIWSKCHCGHRLQSCKDYIDKLSSYQCRFKEKQCYMYFFFKKHIIKIEDINRLHNNDLLGFCIVHRDLLMYLDNQEDFKKIYVTENIITNPLNPTAFVFNPHPVKIKINNKDFRIDGNYFSQQNGITNVCAHAAIKMAIRGYDPSITAEKINEAGNIDHSKKEGKEGLSPSQIARIIKILSGKKVISKQKEVNAYELMQLSELETFTFSTLEQNSIDFLTSVYYALESRLPVILLFAAPKIDGADKDSADYHAITIIGHTFSEHNWWPYALRHYFDRQAIGLDYLPSYLWCDNFIVQDDNFGPYYFLPSRFLTDFSGIGRAIFKLHNDINAIANYPINTISTLLFHHDLIKEQNKRFSSDSFNLWINKPIYAIVVCPKSLDFLIETPAAERIAKIKLREYLEYLISPKIDKNIGKNISIPSYFADYFNKKVLIFRTIGLSKKEYLAYLHKNPAMEMEFSQIELRLPDYFWVSEISVPGIFLNKEKIGEIIIDPVEFNKTDIDGKKGVVFLRLFNTMASIENDEFKVHLAINEKTEYSYPLLQSKGLSRLLE